MRYKAARKRLIADMATRVRAFAPNAAPQPAPAASPEPSPG
jgi:hypothetical protein